MPLPSVRQGKHKTKRAGMSIPARFTFVYPAIMCVGKRLLLGNLVISREYMGQTTLAD
jgi:hypothetical protein